MKTDAAQVERLVRLCHPGERRNADRERGAVQSTCAPDALMIGAHFASSDLMNCASFSGVLPGVGSTPTSCRRLRMTGSASALLIASLRAVMTGAGVFAGARIAFQV